MAPPGHLPIVVYHTRVILLCRPCPFRQAAAAPAERITHQRWRRRQPQRTTGAIATAAGGDGGRISGEDQASLQEVWQNRAGGAPVRLRHIPHRWVVAEGRQRQDGWVVCAWQAAAHCGVAFLICCRAAAPLTLLATLRATHPTRLLCGYRQPRGCEDPAAEDWAAVE